MDEIISKLREDLKISEERNKKQLTTYKEENKKDEIISKLREDLKISEEKNKKQLTAYIEENTKLREDLKISEEKNEKQLTTYKEEKLTTYKEEIKKLTEENKKLTIYKEENVNNSLNGKLLNINTSLILINYFLALFKEGSLPKLKCEMFKEAKPSSTHPKCKFTKIDFGIINNIQEIISDSLEQLGSKRSNILHIYNQGELRYINEYEMGNHINSLFKDIVALSGLEGKIKLTGQVGLNGLIPDFWVVNFLGSPIGAIEVKLDAPHVMESEKIMGQAFDHLIRLHHHDGLENAFCILTSYNKFRIVCTEQSKGLAMSTASIKPITKRSTNFNQNEIPENLDQVKNFKIVLDEDVQRNVFCSEIYDRTNKDIIKILCSIVKKMSSIKSDPNFHHSKLRRYTVVSNMPDIYCSVNIDFKPPNERANITDLSSVGHSYKIVLIKSLGGGGDGFAWLGMLYSTKEYVVVKFFNEAKSFKQERLGYSENNEELLKSIKMESDNWKIFYGVKTIPTELSCKKCLIMPFFKISETTDWNKEGFCQLVKNECKRFLEMGYCHMDLGRHHVAKLLEGNETKIIFIDLHRVKIIKEEEKEECYNEMLKEVGLQDQNETKKIAKKVKKQQQKQTEEKLMVNLNSKENMIPKLLHIKHLKN
ncbi:hypothetical protein ACTA71_000314 [Dictyostelium dimigraforme]